MEQAITVAAPLNELAVRNAKNAGECEELHMANRNISHLADKNSMKNDFEMFSNLEVLWINDNRLSRLDGLSANFRIKTLYAHNNRISSLKDSSIEDMTFLSSLTLYEALQGPPNSSAILPLVEQEGTGEEGIHRLRGFVRLEVLDPEQNHTSQIRIQAPILATG